jgi:hypothetical protein
MSHVAAGLAWQFTTNWLTIHDERVDIPRQST